MKRMWGEEEFPFSSRIGDHVEWEIGKDTYSGEVVDVLRDYSGGKAYQLLVRNSKGYHEVELEDVYFWEPYGEDKELDEYEIARIELYKYIKKWELWRGPIDDMLNFIFQDEEDEDYEI